MKKILLLTTTMLLGVVLIGYFLYLNSESYSIKLATKARDEELTKLNNIPRRYIVEGLYSYECFRSKEKAFVDKFGGLIVTPYLEYVGNAEVSFTSRKIVLVLNERREELVLGDPYIASIFSKDHIEYLFPISEWKAYINNTCYFSFDSSENKQYRTYNRSMNQPNMEPTLSLTIELQSYNDIHKVAANIKIYQLNQYLPSTIGQYKVIQVPLLGMGNNESDRDIINERAKEETMSTFKIIPYNNGEAVDMTHLKYKYESNVATPKYFNARYQRKYYDLNWYLKLIGREKNKTNQ